MTETKLYRIQSKLGMTNRPQWRSGLYTHEQAMHEAARLNRAYHKWFAQPVEDLYEVVEESER